MALSYIILLFTTPSAGVSLGLVGGSMLAVVLGLAFILLGAAVADAKEREERRQAEGDDQRGD